MTCCYGLASSFIRALTSSQVLQYQSRLNLCVWDRETESDGFHGPPLQGWWFWGGGSRVDVFLEESSTLLQALPTYRGDG